MIGRKTKGGLISSASGEPPALVAATTATGDALGLGLELGLDDGDGVGVAGGAASSVKPEQRLPFDSLTQTWWRPGVCGRRHRELGR